MRRSVCLLAIIVATSNSLCVGQTYSEIVAFGASLTDAGNNFVATGNSPDWDFAVPVSPPYFEGRWSNGPVWVDVLADLLDLDRPTASLAGGNNYAYGGATTGASENIFGVVDMDDQVATYLAEKEIAGDELFFVSASAAANDFSARNPNSPEPQEAAQKVTEAVNELASAGAKNIVVPLASRPLSQNASPLIPLFNIALRDQLADARLAHPETTITEFDAFNAMRKLEERPGRIGIQVTSGFACQDCAIDNPNPTEIVANPNEYFYWDGHPTAPVHEALAKALFDELPTPHLIKEDFDDVRRGELPSGTSLLDSNQGQPWGPSIITTGNGKIGFQTSGKVPPHERPERPLETGFMALTWDVPKEGPSFTDGSLRATLNAPTLSDANLIVRADPESLHGYLFTGLGPLGRFFAYRFDEAGGNVIGDIGDLSFALGLDYHLEVGAIGDQITMKAWRADKEEPEFPQMVIYDDKLTEGTVGLIPSSSPTALSSPVQVDVTYDDVRFLPSVRWDINQDSVLDAKDIDLLTDTIAGGVQHAFLDLTRDKAVDAQDRQLLIEELANSFFGDANLDGRVDFADFLVLSANFAEPGGWADGNFDGVGNVEFPDFLLLSKSFGSATPGVHAVPEPERTDIAAIIFLTLVAGRLRRGRNRIGPKS